MQAGLKFADALTLICDWAARIAALLLFILVGVIIYDVIFHVTGT
jgi:hypothetical protein